MKPGLVDLLWYSSDKAFKMTQESLDEKIWRDVENGFRALGKRGLCLLMVLM